VRRRRRLSISTYIYVCPVFIYRVSSRRWLYVTGNGGSRRIRDLIGPITPITYVITLCTKQKLIAAVPNAKRPITPCAEIAFIGSGVKRVTRKKPISFQTQLDGSVIFSRCNVKMKILKKCDLRPSTMAHGDDKDNKVWTNVNMKNIFFD
jgi:hypothetical protein